MSFKRSVCILTLIASILAGAMLGQPLCVSGQTANADLPRFMPNVVHLTVTFSNGDAEQGFGFIIGEEDVGTPDKPDVRYYVATANHVVWQNNPDATVTEIKAKFCAYPRKSFVAQTLDVADPEFDVAIIEIPKPIPKFQWEPAAFDENPAVKTDAWFLGLQGDCLESEAFKITKVSYAELTLLTNQIQEGTSGAPLISNKGLIGLITRNEPAKATAVKIGVIRQLAENFGIPWGLQAFTATAAVPPTPEPIGEPTATPTTKPAAKPTATPTAKPAATATPKPRPTTTPEPVGPEQGDVWTEPTTGMKFVWIPEGCFQMGSPASETGRYDDEGPVHKACVDGFWMGQYEVTNAQYRQFKNDHDSQSYEGKTLNGDSQPAVYVSWEDAKAFADWLTKQSGEKYAFGLPSEAQWEYAARAGEAQSRYWGDNSDNACQYANVHDQTSKKAFTSWTHEAHNCNDGYAVTAPVGQFTPNAFGLYDMLGNVWEWCADWYASDYYANSPQDNPPGPSGGSGRVLRGGGWGNAPRGVRSAGRSDGAPSYWYDLIGFRLSRTN